ncbi:MAG: LOG family protein, partial [Planctomycetota bacterium]|jgi:uncharacterized protein (TIGR00730 family)
MAESRRRRYQLKNAELNTLLEQLVERAEDVYGEFEDTEFVRQILVSGLRLMRDRTPRGDLKLVNSALKELRHAMNVFAPYEHIRKVSVFGSARTGPGHDDFKQAHAFAERIVAEGWMVITGAGDGIMGAAQDGAGRDKSFGVNIRLPFEQRANEVIAGDKKLINFRYFFTRKVMFVKESHAIALFPGGFGTHDEGYEALTLIQTGKSEILPVVFVDSPGGDYWLDWDERVRAHLHSRNLIDEDDLSLFKVTDDVEVAIHEILNFYSNYHSSRFVGDLLVLRVRRAPNPEQLAALNEDFKEIVDKGRIEVHKALPDEEGEVARYPRVTLQFNRRSVGKLRQLIDRLNSYVEERASPPIEASPHEIRELQIGPEAESLEEEE